MSMSILVHAEGFRLRDDLKEKTIAKVERLEPHVVRALRARVTLRRVSMRPSDRQFEAAILIEVPGNDISATQKAAEPLDAVDKLVEKAAQLLRKQKTAKLSRRTTEKLGESELKLAGALS